MSLAISYQILKPVCELFALASFGGDDPGYLRPVAGPTGPIHVPIQLRHHPVDSLPVSFRLMDLLLRAGIGVLGDLHGRSPSDFILLRGWGSKMAGAFRAMIRLMRHSDGLNLFSGLSFNPDSFVFVVPASLVATSFGQLPASKRLKYITRVFGIKYLGDVNGRPARELLPYGRIGYLMIGEIRELITRVAAGEFANFRQMLRSADIPLVDLPISRRLTCLASEIGASRLGDFATWSANELVRYRNVGAVTVAEITDLIQRASLGEFEDVLIDDSEAPAALAALIETGIARLSPADQDILLARIGASGEAPLTLQKIADEQGVTRERVRQIVDRATYHVRRTAWPRIPRLLKVVKQKCISGTYPVTPELLRLWLCGSDERLNLSLKTHVRLIWELDSEIPCWPNGHDGQGSFDRHLPGLASILVKTVTGRGGCLSVAKAYIAIRSHPSYGSLSAYSFFRTLRRMRDITIGFGDPDRPVIFTATGGQKLSRRTARASLLLTLGESRTAVSRPFTTAT